MARHKTSLSEKFKQKGSKKPSTERKQAVANFLYRDENSLLLSGKRDTITKTKQKMQRTVLTKLLFQLHALYQTEVEPHLSVSYNLYKNALLSLNQRPEIDIPALVWNMKISIFWSANYLKEDCWQPTAFQSYWKWLYMILKAKHAWIVCMCKLLLWLNWFPWQTALRFLGNNWRGLHQQMVRKPLQRFKKTAQGQSRT